MEATEAICDQRRDKAPDLGELSLEPLPEH